MAIVALTTSADQTTWADTVPGAVATGYQAQNTNIQAGYLGVDTLEIEEELILETTSDWDIKVKIKPGLIDVNGRIINVTSNEITGELVDFSKLNPATGTFSDLFLVVKNNAGVYSIEYHYPIDSGMPVYDVEKKGFYNLVGERILSYRASPIFVEGYGVGLSILKTDPIAEGYIQSGGTITNTPTATLRTSLTAYEYKIPAGIKWHQNDINATTRVCAGGAGLLVILCDGGFIYTISNDDLFTPVVRSGGVAENFNSIIYRMDRFVAVGNNGALMTSPDGITWTERTSNTSENLNKVAFADGLFVAVGDNGTIITSDTGYTWTARASGTTNNLKDIIYANSLWGAVGADGAICHSSDGVTWSVLVASGFDINSIGYGDGNFILCCDDGKILSTYDFLGYGIKTSGTTEHLNKVAYANGLWVAVGDNGTIITSPTRSTWTVRTSGTSDNLKTLIYTGFVWVAGSYTIITSFDGENWNSRLTDTFCEVVDSTYSNGILSLVGGYHTSGKEMKFSTEKDLWDDRNEA